MAKKRRQEIWNHCTRCGKKEGPYPDDYTAEVAYNQHVCEGLRPLAEMDEDLLREVAYKRMTEAEAWATQDGRRPNA